MGQNRKNHSKEFKAKVALEAVKDLHTLSELAARYKVHPTQIGVWKKQLMEQAPRLFERGRASVGTNTEGLTAPLYQEIGRLKMEVDFLQKNSWAHARRNGEHG
jgi:transposase-like protein